MSKGEIFERKPEGSKRSHILELVLGSSGSEQRENISGYLLVPDSVLGPPRTAMDKTTNH